MRIEIHPRLILRTDSERRISLVKGIKLLEAIERTGNLTAASKALAISYRNGWDLLKDMELGLGGPVVVMRKGHGSILTDLGRRLLFAQQLVEAKFNPLLDSMAAEVEAEIKRAVGSPAPVLKIFASHDFAVEKLNVSLQQKQIETELNFEGSLAAVSALDRGLCQIAGFHIPIGELEVQALRPFEQFLQPHHRLIHLATRRQGIMVQKGNPQNIWHIADLLRPEVRFVNRQQGSGTRLLLDLLLQKESVAVDELLNTHSVEFTHAAVAARIASDRADCGLGVETAARQAGLDFVPLLNEAYFFVCHEALLTTEQLDTLLMLMRSNEFKSEIGELAGYDATLCGQFKTVEAVFATRLDHVA